MSSSRKHIHVINLSWDRIDLTKSLMRQETVYRSLRQIAKENGLTLHELLNIAVAQMSEYNPLDRTQPDGAWLVITFHLPQPNAVNDGRAQAA